MAGPRCPAAGGARDVTVLDGLRRRRRGADRHMTEARAGTSWSAPARRPSAPAPASSPPIPWRWCRKRLGLAPPGSAMLPAVYSQAPRHSPGVPVGRAHGDPTATAARCRATWSRARPGERLRRRGGDRRLDQCRAAPSRDRPRGRHPLHARRCRRRSFARTPLIGDLQPGGKFLAPTSLRGGVDAVLKAPARWRLPARRVARRCPAHARRDTRPHSAGARWRGGAAGRTPLQSDRRIGRAQGQSRARWRADQGRRAEALHLRGPARVFDSEEAACARCGDARLPGGRRADDPLRRAARRAGHARDARRHRADLRPGDGREGRAADRRPLFRRDARHLVGYVAPGGRSSAGPIALARDRRRRDDRCGAGTSISMVAAADSPPAAPR